MSDKLLAEVEAELAEARLKHAPLNSLHEAYAVLLEEVDELWDECRKRRSERNKENIRKELIQIAAMALRTIIDVVDGLNVEKA